MTKDEALKMAIEALETSDAIVAEYSGVNFERIQPAIQACKEALEQQDRFEGYTTIEIGHKKPAQEPVAWINQWENVFGKHKYIVFEKIDGYFPLYTRPAPSWQTLSDDEQGVIFKNQLGHDCSCDPYSFYLAIEQALKDKNT